ncbi:MAG: tRNA (adenosine(37)-N6)-threonylcarbamoyltransferase complex dimerization subunit type 1 TsaB [Alphaproteobacteria bacterium]
MRVLAFDTSLHDCAVAIAAPDMAAPLIRSQNVDRAHGERLLVMIRDAMADAELDFTTLDRIAVTVGPGSFTGVRIGVAAARGLALATGLPVVGIDNLAVHAALARAAAGQIPVVAATEGGRGQIYVQRFAANGAPASVAAAGLPESFAGTVAQGDAVAGSGAARLVAAIGRDEKPVHERSVPDIALVAHLATLATPGEEVRPLYLRRPDAKPQTGAAVQRR